MKISHNKPSFDVEEESAARRVISSGWVAQGKEVEGFENELCSYLGLPPGHAVAVSSGSAALFMALHVLGCRGMRVALPVYSCSALSNAVSMCGAEPVFIDTGVGSPNIDLDIAIAQRTEVCIVPYMFGIPLRLADSGTMNVIEDCAQALGAWVNGVPVGVHGKIGVFSFYATKVITSGGQGGMLVSNDMQLVNEIRDYRDFDYRKDKKGRFNFQMTDLQAAIGRVQLSKLPYFIARRQYIFERYKASGLDLLAEPDGLVCTPIRYRAIMKTQCQHKIITAMRNMGISTIVPIEEWELLDVPDRFPNAFDLTKRTVSLPIYPTLSDKELQYIISTVAEL